MLSRGFSYFLDACIDCFPDGFTETFPVTGTDNKNNFEQEE